MTRIRAALLVGLVVGFVVGVDLLRWIRPALLLDSHADWALPRLALSLFWIAASAGAAGLAAGGSYLWFGRRSLRVAWEPLAVGRGALVACTALAIATGAYLRFTELGRLPPSLWIDDVTLIAPTLELERSPRDFADSIRVHPYGVPKPFGAVGVLYLELFRVSLDHFGTTVFGVRFLYALAGAISLVTGALLGRALLPRGGGTLVALILSALRWSLIVSRWTFAIVIVPLVDVGTLLLIRARRRGSWFEAAGAGILLGLAAHVYLSSWIAAAALLLFAIWPGAPLTPSLRARLGVLFLAGFAVAVAPLFLLREGRRGSYFARTSDHNVRLEIARTRSLLPPFAAAADAVAAPWFLSDPIARHDLPNVSRLGLLGIPLALVLGRSLVTPREDLSALILAHGGAALAANVTGGQADLPNGIRFLYLMSVAAVAIAGGILWLLSECPPRLRRVLGIVSLGGVAVLGALQARQALWLWAEGRAAFDGFGGQDTLLACAANRWESFGQVWLDPKLGHYALTIQGVRRYRLDPFRNRRDGPDPSGPAAGRRFRIIGPNEAISAEERVVEWVQDAWGRKWGKVIAPRGRPGNPAGSPATLLRKSSV